ncbi:TPA: restriction endonuclease subunit S [Enterococcus faecium]|uniref:restriction endonuclease subunit S n=1 Tax=Enterococcus faecium TaxID=1352 RepID=UPI000F64BA58|nr:restriction endonuclease subunit S [Enterococcus faecium]EGP4752017.1 restriction endonuclease subunit S [Enterococcus faecium]EGP5042544.1 restriction endonuclease subunit S [Enterococcus faecium]EGP5181332.1 restriction endonuclease subunit S [Enterococcus faecium]EMF0346867.1 restriction endonuclease subunit S [Enterococcus faecium]EMF0428368.1 restriction endonuclease subunit S [Enterococcus faecium]
MSNDIQPEIRFPGFTEAWEQRKFECLLDKKDGVRRGPFGSALKKEFFVSNSNFVVYEQQNAIYDNYETRYKITEKKYNELIKFKLEPGDFIMSGAGTIGRISRVPKQIKPGVFNQALIRLRINKEITDSEYFIQFIRADFMQRKLTGANPGSAITNLVPMSEVKKWIVQFPILEEQKKIGNFFKQLDDTIALQQRKLDLLKETKKGFLQKMFPKNGAKVPEVRFPGFTEDWEQRKLGDEFEKVNERNDGSFGKDKWISVAKMYFQDPEKVQSNNIDTRTYVMRLGDIAFEGHPNADFKFGRFVVNDIGEGVVSELFPIYRHKQEYDNNYWKYAIQLERIMAPIFAKSITSSGNSSNKLYPKHFLRQRVSVASIDEQHKIGDFLLTIDRTIALHQRKLDLLKETKKGFLQKMFV